MDEKTALASTLGAGQRLAFRPRSTGTLKRLQHLLWAGAVAFAMLAVFLLEPVTQLSWLIQSRLGGHQPSGDIVFVGTSSKVEEPSQVGERRELTKALHELDAQGVGKVYVDFVLAEGASEQVDADLAEALDQLGPRVVLVDQIEMTSDGLKRKLVKSNDRFSTEHPRVASTHSANYLGYMWQDFFAYDEDLSEGRKSLAASIAGVDTFDAKTFQIDYGFDPSLIPTLELGEVAKTGAEQEIDLSGKTVLIGPAAEAGASNVKVPGLVDAPPSFVSIYAAETLKSGRIGFLGGLTVLAFLCAAMALIILANPVKGVRRALYFGVVIALPGLMVFGAKTGVRVEITYALALLLVYAALRSRARWRLRVASIDSETGLPKLRILEQIIAKTQPQSGHIVVARLHGFEHVIKTLGSTERARYVHRLVDRLRAADSELTIYVEGHYLAWQSDEAETERLVDHLEGLRAIFAAPIRVGEESVDVGITFGLANLGAVGLNAVPAAAAAAEETSEAHRPIKIAEVGSRHDELWDISLRARIDDAMQAGEIFCVYQPKIDTIAGTLTGVEALVRWHDPERGFIPPMKFIAQCEKAGRMEHLTRYVLQTACNAGRLLHFRGTAISMSVNISATLLGDMRIVGIVRNTLQATGFDARYLILEITETSRIGNLETAAAILTELKALGLRISIDDFGVGSANFETLFELPFDELKIDRLFVDSISRSAKARAITSSMVAMGNAARITVVAEGAEDAKTLQILNEIGCRYVQGYALARPLSLTNLLEYKVSSKEVASGT